VFLKRIVLHSFKSFADRTEFEFGSGITAVVGPNGCGKSNLLDAVRWVLGEQSARSLRGDRMADVIFTGSRSRKRANFAEVQLTFDNRTGILRADQPEVTVGRVLYRSGESEYRLNGNPCRLRDIRELLLDTGVGVDAYSVIEQGRVDVLLQASPLERRQIFEEAAGISRYKLRRIEAERKLERTQNNLLRLRDILEELEKHLRSVRYAAGKARNYQRYDARLRELRSGFAMSEYHELEQARLAVQREIETLTAGLHQERARLAACDAETAELNHARQKLDQQVQAAETGLHELQSALSALGERIAQGEKRLPELAVLRDRRRSQATEVLSRLATLEERGATEQAALQDLLAAEKHSAAKIEELQAARQAAEARAEQARQALEREKVAAFEAVRRGALLQNELENGAQQQGRLTARLQRLSSRQQETEREHESLTGRVTELTEQAAALDRQVAELTGNLRTDETELATLAGQVEELDQQISAAKEARSAVLSRLTLLEDMEQRLEGVDAGTRAVLTWRDEECGRNLVLGLVADLLRIDDPRVSILQPVLSTFENYVVVRGAETFVAELTRRGGRTGPLRVLSMDRLAGRSSPPAEADLPDGMARAADWVACAEEFRPLAEHLLGWTFVVETMDQALRLAAGAPPGCVFVTRVGDTVGADGRLTFGAAGPVAGLISRKAQIRQLHSELEEVEARLVQLTRQRLELNRAVSDLRLRQEELLQQIATLQREHADVLNERARTEYARQRLEREAGLLGDEVAGVRRSLDEVVGQMRGLKAECDAMQAAQGEHETQVAALAASLAEAEATAAGLSLECTDALVASGRAAEKRAAAEQAVEELRARCAVLQREITQAQQEAEETVRQIQAAEQQLQEARQAQADQAGECQQRQEEVLQLRQRRQELRQQLEACGVASREVQRRLEAVESAIHEKQVSLRESEVRQESLVARVRDELGVDLAELYQTYEPGQQDWEAVKREIQELREKIVRLGNVNLDAIAELEELSPRYEHLVAQRDDLVHAIERLEGLIADLDRESRTRFAETFEQVRANFQEMFRRLFGGGKADVLLTDPEHPLECGIEIIARPPGKEAQSLSLLSGGEKALAAVALLLGVFRCRPSPFAILDEVDAALDESNIERFNRVLQEFLPDTQFVVITHSKRTMAGADMLYGITMEEPGVSQRVSVRFEDRVQTPIVA
jgi:chromosome segregation protein